MANMDVLESAEAQGASSASKRRKEETPRKFQRVVNGKGGKGKGPDKKRQEPSAEGDPHWEGRHSSSEFQLLKTLVLRHKHSLRQLAVDRGYVLFFSTSDMSTLTLLKEVTNHWQQSYQEKKTTTLLRAALLTSLWLELEARLTKLESDQAATKFYVDSGHLHLNPTRWSYTMWDQDKQQSLPTEAPALTNQEIVAALKILKAAALTDGVIHKFSPLHKLSDNPQSKVVVFQLVLTTGPTAEKVHAEMSKLTSHITGGLAHQTGKIADIAIGQAADDKAQRSLRRQHRDQGLTTRSGITDSSRPESRGLRTPHPEAEGSAAAAPEQLKGYSDPLPPGNLSKGSASVPEGERTETCTGPTVSSAGKTVCSTSRMTGNAPKLLVQSSLSSWQVGSGRGNLEAPCYLFANRANYCYMNASAAGLHWAMRAMRCQEGDLGSLGPALMAISRLRRFEIPTQHDWKAQLRGWRRPAQQHDAAEFISHVTDPSAIALAGSWQARCLERGRSPICDQGSSAPYIGVDITGHSSLQSALNAWHHQHYTYALSDPPRLLCLQMGRFRHEGRRTVKVRHRCQVPQRLQVPVFGGELLECTEYEYVLCSGIVHVGDTAASGHYRAMCIHSPLESVRSEVSSPVLRYTLCDDDRQASQRSPNLDNLLDHNLYVVLCSRLDPESGPPGRS